MRKKHSGSNFEGKLRSYNFTTTIKTCAGRRGSEGRDGAGIIIWPSDEQDRLVSANGGDDYDDAAVVMMRSAMMAANHKRNHLNKNE